VAPATAQPEVASIDSLFYTPTKEHLWIKALFYGDPGVGKTTLGASAQAVPEMQDVLILNIEGGLMSIVNPEVYGAETLPKVIDYQDYSTVQALVNYLYREKHGFKTLFVDSLSELAKVDVDQIASSQSASRVAMGKGTADDIFLEDYGRNTKRMRRVIRALRNLPMHVIMSAHAMTLDEKNSQSPIVPAIREGIRYSAEGMFDIIGYMYIKAEPKTDADDEKDMVLRRRCLFRSLNRYTAPKDRTPGQKLPMIMEEPSMKAIYDYFTGKVTA
jgi:hypothetical protein